MITMIFVFVALIHNDRCLIIHSILLIILINMKPSSSAAGTASNTSANTHANTGSIYDRCNLQRIKREEYLAEERRRRDEKAISDEKNVCTFKPRISSPPS